MEIDINEVFAAIDTLYNEKPANVDSDAHAERLRKASEWLGNLQKSVSIIHIFAFIWLG